MSAAEPTAPTLNLPLAEAATPKNVPGPPPGTTASTRTPPEGARTGAAGPVSSHTSSSPGRSTLTAPIGAGAAPVSMAKPDGHIRTGAAGPVNAESPAPGRSAPKVADAVRRELLDISTPADWSDEPLGHCGHPVDLSEWWNGHRSCPRCEKRDELLREEQS
jgi:hypothetical protein